VITMAKCPVLCFSRLQTEMALSTMMAESIVLSSGMGDIVSLKWLAEEVCTHMGLDDDDKKPTIKAKSRTILVHEGNHGTLTLANLKPGRSSSTFKFFNMKYHWFWEELILKKIVAIKV
jgi:hypothetical protein